MSHGFPAADISELSSLNCSQPPLSRGPRASSTVPAFTQTSHTACKYPCVPFVASNRYEFNTVVEFKRLIVQEKQRFLRAFLAHLLAYALSRELGPADSPALDEMTAKAMAGEDQIRAVLKSVAMSEPFLHKNMKASVAEHETSE